ncbi:MAG: hypothetical protein IT379_00335 [Deltaproteobacteria bacterium]|nr:hypothetical protein [Deltaproteobacteria bacterium]
MVTRKTKAVVSADADDWQRVESLVGQGRYLSASQFVREAVAEKLARLDAATLDAAVQRYVEMGYATEDVDLVEAQAFDGKKPTARRRTRRDPR